MVPCSRKGLWATLITGMCQATTTLAPLRMMRRYEASAHSMATTGALHGRPFPCWSELAQHSAIVVLSEEPQRLEPSKRPVHVCATWRRCLPPRLCHASGRSSASSWPRRSSRPASAPGNVYRCPDCSVRCYKPNFAASPRWPSLTKCTPSVDVDSLTRVLTPSPRSIHSTEGLTLPLHLPAGW